MFTEQQRVDIRRYAGYAVFGATPVQAFGHRFLTHYGTLEFRMSNLSAAEEATVVANYLTPLGLLETAVPSAGDNLDTAQAAVWYHNKNEVTDRIGLYNWKRRELCSFFGIPPGPNFGGGASNNSIALVV